MALVIAVALTVRAFPQQQNVPDAAAGEIDGKQAVLLWPADGRVIGCRATLVPETDPDAEIHYPCGEWFVPPLGKYKVWIEGPSSISASPTRLTYLSDQFNGKGLMAVFETTSAGEIGLRAPWPGTSLRLLNLDSFASGPLLAPAFDRQASGQNVGPVRMPTGRVLAGVFDNESGDAVALARPVHVIAGGMTYAEPALPARGTDVLVVLDRPNLRERRDAEIVALRLDVDGEQKPPAVFADSSDRMYAVWYGIEGRRARVVSNGRELTFPGREFLLLPRRVVTVRGQLRPLPKLRVEIPPGADLPGDAHVQAKRLSGETLIDVPLHDTVVDLGHLPAEPIEVVLLSPDIELRQRADLTNGLDETVQFRPVALTIHGRLTRGERGVTGNMAFTLGTRKPVTVATNDEGSYTARLWTAGVYRIAATASGTAPFQLSRHLMRDTELNVELPRANVVIEVIDEKKKTAVAGARIVAMPGTEETSRARARVQRAVTDDRGSATLPPIEPGTTQLLVEANNYLRGEHVLEVADSDDTQQFTVELTPVDANGSDRITLRLADGTPASAAQLMLMDAGAMSRVLWSGQSDASGAVAVPRIAGTILLVRHARAGSIPVVVTDGLELRLPAPAPPLAVRFVNSSGMPARYAGIILWTGGIRLSGGALSFLFSFPNATNVDGVWRANNLPQAPLRILAVTSQAGQSAAAAALDTLAVTIGYPWPEFPTLRAAE
ncbi:MAG TPA: hypothetical protein VMS98_08265 [Thermoanaerobaculia bacterium]|nr:hypothetical protein [Thermoanaerobaculia bacterium]